MFTVPGAWLTLGDADQQLLCELAEPWGPLFTWLDGQVHEHGPLPWSALREGLRGHALESVAVSAIERLPDTIVSDLTELQAILRHERPRHLQRRMNAALQAGDTTLYETLLPEWTAAKASASKMDNDATDPH